ncbi:hypothetical protein JCGZ_14111 [Jatropha curcas]|uniref:Uncharacterized protein n=1 Tax=Jatropha curcas TaxID=180498 RepID=A0A067K7U8_JATCU|nr:diacylglycerol O-acyltransferase 3 [Jatropha curcas]XP_037496303.1 diacylglycerol O-acyltransferase 3 [Jatropha curcas]KDP28340.1 hypothetical protein JCGZ_14111 [Jatropha curcas]
MDTAGIVSSPVLRFSESGVNNFSLKLPLGTVNSRVSFKTRDFSGILSHKFSDSGHLQYYVSPTRSGGKKQKEESKEIKTEKKKKLKLMKRLSKDLDLFSRTAQAEEFGSRLNLMDDVKQKMISEATEFLLAELRHLKSEQKEQKRKRKEEKASLINGEAPVDSTSSSSSSSSDSSDSDCEVVMDVSRLGNTAVKQFIENETEHANYREQATLAEISTPVLETTESFNVLNIEEDCRSNCSNESENTGMAVAGGKKIEICMGGKCKKMGAIALLEEFEKKVGKEGAVVGCKCMGKCKNAPNVKVSNCSTGLQGESTLSLCMGVGLEDVDAIVANLLGKDRNDNCLMAIS